MFANVNGVQLFYTVEGEGPDMILLHGNGEDHTIFERSLFFLKNHFTVYSIDSRGHGQSSPVSEYHYSDMTEDVHQFISKLGLDKPALVGFSDGGIIGLLLASKYPDDLSKMIVCGANTNPDALKGFSMNRMRKNPRSMEDPLTRLMLTEPHITASDLSRIKIDTLVVAGSRDCIDESDTDFICNNIPKSTKCIVKHASHDSYIHDEVAFCQIVLSYFDLSEYKKDKVRTKK